jgi:hypothetical protein
MSEITTTPRGLSARPRPGRAADRAGACDGAAVAARRRDLSRRLGEPVPWAFAAAVLRVEAELAGR